MGEEDSRQTIHAASAATPQEGTSKKRPRREVLMEVGAPGNGIVSRSANALTPRHDHLKSRYWAWDPSLRRHGSYTPSDLRSLWRSALPETGLCRAAQMP